MTTIAYRDGVLAGDSRTTESSTIVPTLSAKVFKNAHGWLYGAAGTVSEIIRFREWASNYNGDGRKKGPPGGSYGGVLISPDNKVYAVEGGSVWELKECPFYALGTGQDAAYGALHFGASAREAVEVAIKVDSCSGSPITTVSTKE